jgi:hypothetical protein
MPVSEQMQHLSSSQYDVSMIDCTFVMNIIKSICVVLKFERIEYKTIYDVIVFLFPLGSCDQKRGVEQIKALFS